MTPEQLVGLLAEPTRLRVVAALALGARTSAEIATAAALDTRVVLKALRRLESVGLVSLEATGLVLHAELFKEVASAAPSTPADPVFGVFVRDGKLMSFPANAGKRRAVLEHVVQSFEPGRRYPEKQVNAVLREWCDGGEADHVTLRRYLIDAGLLSRDNEAYWRSGGPVL